MSDEFVQLAKGYMGDKSGTKLSRKYARLYSQFSRLNMHQPGLPTWQATEALSVLDDAVRLIELGFLIKEDDAKSLDQGTDFRRAGELFEWLAHENIEPTGVPTTLLAAACYQLAGLPARSSGLAERVSSRESTSTILKAFLKSDFPLLLNSIAAYWVGRQDEKIEPSATINDFVFDETVRSLGIVCAEVRWGNQNRLKNALEKLSKLYRVTLRGGDTYSWLLAFLCYEVARTYLDSLLRYKVLLLSDQLGQKGNEILERYIRQNYIQKQSLAWPSQIRGIERLAHGESFVLCTPTASGKTAVAELAIIQSLYANDNPEGLLDRAPIALYMVPSRALAFQLEAKLAKVVEHLHREDKITVTGLYGGTDWGPTDAWLTANNRTVLICTYEKAEALIRFLGPLFVHRLSLVIIDEAHQIIYDGKIESLIEGDNRSFRLETLTMRLLDYVARNQNNKVIALSAAAFGAEQALSGWATGKADALPAKASYRSTRQLIGRLICKSERKYEIRYDILDGESLEFIPRSDEQESPTPYVPNPFPPFPPVPDLEKNFSVLQRMYTFWAAFCFAASETRQCVLISLTQNLNYFSATLDELLTEYWTENLPVFFEKPTEPGKQIIWQNCLQSCEDYFGKDSAEYRLLEKGIVVHQGQIPGKISKWLLDVISERIVRVVLATSTLTDGVNLPFEVILIPRLERMGKPIQLQEFENLVGRAGRPGVSTEGKSLVVVTDEAFYSSYTTKKARDARETSDKHTQRYLSLKNEFLKKLDTKPPTSKEISSLVALLDSIENSWTELKSPLPFEKWLEFTAPLNEPIETLSDLERKLDTLDGALLSAIVEIEQLSLDALQPNELEQRLKDIWARSFAKYSSLQEERLGRVFIRRGLALERLYNENTRRRIYSTSLPPRHASQLLEKYPTIKSEMARGFEYWSWNKNEKYQYIKNVVSQIDQVSKFKLEQPVKPLKCNWDDILHWWLDPFDAPLKPGKDTSQWLKYISTNFVYRVSWGIGSVLGLVANELHEGQITEFNLKDWPNTNLPWVVFWIKELLHWGTLDPAASYLLSRGMEVTRSKAELFANNYYHTYQDIYDSNDLLNPINIREWTLKAQKRLETTTHLTPPEQIVVRLARDFSQREEPNWRVIPVIQTTKVIWMDIAGYPLAESSPIENWQPSFVEQYDFELYPSEKIVRASRYA